MLTNLEKRTQEINLATKLLDCIYTNDTKNFSELIEDNIEIIKKNLYFEVFSKCLKLSFLLEKTEILYIFMKYNIKEFFHKYPHQKKMIGDAAFKTKNTECIYIFLSMFFG
ncbi:hypothetical protein M0R19_03390 [Candidatus Pacearchaeota archaeon]|jgi:hypothetical protein|nr:hypothetical protein [Candidatus Pacearchaeota archaeon]